MISIFRPYQGATVADYIGKGPTPILPFNHTIESLTRDVYVKPLHSHNDYWRAEPFFDALGAGCQSIESDVWFFPEGQQLERTVTKSTQHKQQDHLETIFFKNNEVYVGHTLVFLKPVNTLFNMYLNPMLQFLNFVNADIQQGSKVINHDKYSIFFNSPEDPLYFWMDFKTDPELTYEAIKPLFDEFIEKGYLAYYDTKLDKFVPGPIVVTITGNLPVEAVKNEDKVYFFLDGALEKFTYTSTKEQLENIAKYSKVASTSLDKILGDSYQSSKQAEFTHIQKKKIKSYVALAHKYGLKTRIWGDITWPMNLVKSHLNDFYALESDFLNVDDVKQAKDYF